VLVNFLQIDGGPETKNGNGQSISRAILGGVAFQLSTCREKNAKVKVKIFLAMAYTHSSLGVDFFCRLAFGFEHYTG
jgi:hypothetical protein